ncbi:UNVERIFIED_CONTAM: hypothetical protein Sradi_4990800 [Sesamum radiatum]|uniref:Uncharacterized protein n=1 Tax=Sesamum radiatum TaxID=300843 RepID=A0AAW2MIX5_SESRA
MSACFLHTTCTWLDTMKAQLRRLTYHESANTKKLLSVEDDAGNEAIAGMLNVQESSKSDTDMLLSVEDDAGNVLLINIYTILVYKSLNPCHAQQF